MSNSEVCKCAIFEPWPGNPGACKRCKGLTWVGEVDLTQPGLEDMIEPVSQEEMQVLLRLITKKLPAVLAALDEGGNGWKQTMTLACYLLAIILNRHPEYTGSVFSLLNAFQDHYPGVEAAFTAENPSLVSELIKQDTAFFLLPTEANQRER